MIRAVRVYSLNSTVIEVYALVLASTAVIKCSRRVNALVVALIALLALTLPSAQVAKPGITSTMELALLPL